MLAVSEALSAAHQHFDAGRLPAAAAIYRDILKAAPHDAVCLHRMGVIAAQMGAGDSAAEWLRRATFVKPDFAEAHNDLGNVLLMLHRPVEASRAYQQALALRPDYREAHYNLGAALCAQDRIADAFVSFTRHARLKLADPEATTSAPAHKLRHDAEQRDYLLATGIGDIGSLHIEHGDRVDAGVLNPDLKITEIETRWATGRPSIVVIDDLLTDEALSKLRRFCWGSTVWRKTYSDGYLGAMPAYGFGSPLMAQVADAMRTSLPAIFAQHHLTLCWAFKYDSRMSGTKLHADFAAVNVNFWITPDDANRDPASGGLVVWDTPAPADWDFDKYNADVPAIRRFLAERQAKAMTVPYRANRAVIFDSDLFHETDRIDFADGYTNRRINITLLYGWRHAPG